MGELQSALDELAALDLGELPDGALLDHLREMGTAANRISAHVTRVVRRVDVRSAAEHDARPRPGRGCAGTPGCRVRWPGGLWPRVGCWNTCP